MKEGIVKWFSDTKGFGFIVTKEETSDIFVHYHEVVMHDRKTLVPNQRVLVEYKQSEHGLRATKVIPQPDEK